MVYHGKPKTEEWRTSRSSEREPTLLASGGRWTLGCTHGYMNLIALLLLVTAGYEVLRGRKAQKSEDPKVQDSASRDFRVAGFCIFLLLLMILFILVLRNPSHR